MKSSAGKLHKFADMIDDLRLLAKDVPLDVLYDELIDRTGYIRMLQEKKEDENISRIENVRELKTNIIGFINDNGGSLFDFLSETALYTDLDRDDQSSDRVFMMTMHSAKGLEFDTVFVVGAEEGIFPGARAIGEPNEMEEERRLCYVAMTRAKRRLYFMSARRRMLFGRTTASEPSRFVYEISSDNIEINEQADSFNAWSWTDGESSGENVSPFERAQRRSFSTENTQVRTYERARGHSAKPIQQPSIAYSQISQALNNRPQDLSIRGDAAFTKGDVVEHKAFGRGIITSVDAAGGDALLEIKFDKFGDKRLMLNSALRYMSKLQT